MDVHPREGRTWSKIFEQATKLKNIWQLAGFVIAIAAFLLLRIQLPTAADAQLLVVLLGISFLYFGQLFARLDKMQEGARAPVLFFSFLTFCVSIFFVHRIAKAPALLPPYLPAEQTLITLGNEMAILRGSYETMLDPQARAPRVNGDARRMVKKIRAVNDSALKTDMQIFKYQSLAYALTMAAESEMVAANTFNR